MNSIVFHKADIKFNFVQPNNIRNWFNAVVLQHHKSIEALAYVFCSDAYLLELNVAHLQHDTYTDIITFDLSDQPNTIEAEIYISIERVANNALEYNVPFSTELARVLIHGILHLCGLKDKSEQDQKLMRKAEDEAIELLRSTWNIPNWTYPKSLSKKNVPLHPL